MAGLEEGNTNRKVNANGAGPSRSHKMFSCHNHWIKGPVVLPQEMKQRTGEEWWERPADNCCRCAEQGTKLMSSKCAEGVYAVGARRPRPALGKKKNMDTQSRGELDPDNYITLTSLSSYNVSVCALVSWVSYSKACKTGIRGDADGV